MKRMMLICLLVLCLLPLGGWAESSDEKWFTFSGDVYNESGEHFFYTIEGNHAVLAHYSVDSDKPQPARVVVPDTFEGKPLTVINGGAFNNWDNSYDGDKVECLVLPECVTELKAYAFECAHGVQRIELPSTLDKIALDDPFHHVYAEISFPNGNPFYIVENGFLIDTRTESLIYCNPSAHTLPLPRVRRIEHSALSNYSYYQKTLEFPDSVEYIGPYNAYDCTNLEKIIVPGSVIELADHALCINLAKEIILNEGLQKIGSEALFDTSDFTITIPSTVTWIGYSPEWLDPEGWLNSANYDDSENDEEDEEDEYPEEDDDSEDADDSEDDLDDDEEYEEDEDYEDYDDSEEDDDWEEDEDYNDSEERSLIVLNPDVHWETEEEYNARFADNSIDQKTISVGDTVTFGNYAQDNDQSNGKEPIEWIVLDVQDGKALLLSKYGLSAAGYHNTWDDCTWETCSMRTWLNDRFLNWAFSLEEQAAILTTTVDNSDPQGYDWTLIGGEKMPGGNNTQDRIFLLSCAEANRYLNVTIEDANNVNARVAPTAYAITLGVNTSDEYRTAEGDVTGWWWLRSPGSCPNSAAGVNHDGSLSYSRAYHRNFIVRPALWIDLNYVDF